MKGQTLRRRIGLLAVLAIVMTLAMTNASVARAQEEPEPSAARPAATPVTIPAAEDGSITITARMCPEEYAGDLYEADCTEIPPDDTAFLIYREGGSREPVEVDGNGVAALPLPAADTPGKVVLSYTIVGRYHDILSAVFCVDEGGTPVPGGVAQPGWMIEVAADGAAIDCAWYLLPDRLGPGDPVTVTYVNLLCPPGYEGENYAADCVTPAGAGKKFSVAVQLHEGDRVGVLGDTGPAGVVTIEIPYAHDVLPDEIYLGQTVDPRGGQQPEDLDPFIADCTRYDGAEQIPTSENGPNGVAVDALVDDAITCIWYNLPPAGRRPIDADADANADRHPETGGANAESNAYAGSDLARREVAEHGHRRLRLGD